MIFWNAELMSRLVLGACRSAFDAQQQLRKGWVTIFQPHFKKCLVFRRDFFKHGFTAGGAWWIPTSTSTHHQYDFYYCIIVSTIAAIAAAAATTTNNASWQNNHDFVDKNTI